MFWKEKKEELEVQKTKMGCCPFSSLCHDREISVAIESVDPVPQHGSQTKPTTQPRSARPSLGVHDPAWERSRAQRAGATELFLSQCLDRDLYVATLFPGILSGLGRNRGLLCHNRDFSILCHDRNLVL